MFSSAEKSTHLSRQQQTAGATFFRKAGENDFLVNQKRPSFFSAPVQAKLTVSSPDDPQEKEADAAADKVMRMAEPAAAPKEEEKLDRKEEKEEEKVQTKPEAPVIAVQRKEDEEVQAKCDCCMHGNDTSHSGSSSADAGEEKEQKVSRKNIGLHHSDVIQCSGRGPPAGSTDFEQSLSSTKGQGSPMPAATQQFMENGFNADFSGVRIHTGSHAESLSRSINAQAFTHGNDIYFNSNKYSPNTHDGGTLLAHELTHTIQQGGVQRKIIQTKPKDHQHGEDGQGVKRRMHSKVKSEVGDDADFNKSPGQMTAEERTKARDIDPSKKREQKAAIKSAGTAKPSVNRPANELPKVKGAAAEGKDKMEKNPEKKDEKEKKKEVSRAKMESSEAKEKNALAAYGRAAKIKMPDKLPPLRAPLIEKPKDSKGKELPVNTALDKIVQALHEIAKLLAENAFELKEQAANDVKEGFKLRGVLDNSWAKTMRVIAGSEVMKQDKEAREKINLQEEEALVKVEEDTAMVKEGAPRMMSESKKAKDEAGPMVEETAEQKSEMESNIPDDDEAAGEAQQQSEDTGKAADGSQKMDDALGKSGERAEKYMQDAVAGEAKNKKTSATINENKGTLANIGKEISRIDTHNAKSETQLRKFDSYPKLVERQTAKRAKSGDELYAAAVTINDQLIDIQEEYLLAMKSLPGKEEAFKKQQEEEAAKSKEQPAEQKMSPEEEMLLNMGNMDPEELDAYLMTMDEEELQRLNSTLNGMPTQEEKNEDSLVGKPDEAGRTKVDFMKAFEGKEDRGPPDPRQGQINEIEKKRGERLGEAKQLADVNFVFLSYEQKQMLAQKLMMKDAINGIFDINILEMGKGMIMGMINPLESLKGVVDGASKLATGVVNLFNADAWRKDPLGNLLQSSADIATGLTMILMSITGIATAITAIMVAITICSFGFAAPFTGPVIAFMATVITTVGGWTIVTGLIALALNALTYIKNLHDAGVAENTDQLIAESDQLKQNMTDGFTSAMAVVGAKGDKAGAAAMKQKVGGWKGAIKEAGGVKNYAKQNFRDFKAGVSRGFKRAGSLAVAGVKMFSREGAGKVRAGIQKAIQRVKSGIKDFGSKTKKGWEDFKKGLKEEFTGKKSHIETAGGVRVPKENGDLGTVGGKKVEAEVDLPDGHTKKVLENGECATCSICKKTREKFAKELDENPGIKKKLDEIEKKLDTDPENAKLITQHIEIEDQLDAIKNPGKPKKAAGSPGSPEHKAQRWEDYNERKRIEGETPQSYERWSSQYDANMRNPQYGGLREQQYRDAIGGKSEIMHIEMPDGSIQKRQVDIKKGNEIYELKTGKESLTTTGRLPNSERIIKDAALVKQGFKVTWVLEGGGTGPLIEALERNGITVVIGPLEKGGIKIPAPPIKGVDF